MDKIKFWLITKQNRKKIAKTWQKVWKIPDNFLYLHCLKIGVMRTIVR